MDSGVRTPDPIRLASLRCSAPPREAMDRENPRQVSRRAAESQRRSRTEEAFRSVIVSFRAFSWQKMPRLGFGCGSAARRPSSQKCRIGFTAPGSPVSRKKCRLLHKCRGGQRAAFGYHRTGHPAMRGGSSNANHQSSFPFPFDSDADRARRFTTRWQWAG